MNRPIALLTDFGTADWFAASMKGVILSVNPRALIVDISHEVPRGDIRNAAFGILSCHSSFPKGTVFAAVVDPGVGSDRLAIAVKAGGYFFVGPDNGVMSLLSDTYYPVEIRLLQNSSCFRKTVSATFHGRDVFAPAAAHLSRGFSFKDLGPLHKDLVRLAMPVAKRTGKSILGTIVYIDGFGNCVTTIAPALLPSEKSLLRVRNRVVPFRSCYADVGTGKPVAVEGSCGLIELCVNKGNAAETLHLTVGDTVTVS